MRAGAKRHGKAVPEHADLEKLVQFGMSCGDCGVQMNWRSQDGKATVATLQHYRDGSLGLVCLSCNSRHASMIGDSYRDMAKNHKYCPRCKTVKHEDEFSADNNRSGPLKRKSHCKVCSDESVRKWRQEKRDEYNAYQRAWRAANKARLLAEMNQKQEEA